VTDDDEIRTDPMRTAVRKMRGVFAQLERGLIRQRTTKGRQAKAAQGGYIGGAPPLGKRADGSGGSPSNDRPARASDLGGVTLTNDPTDPDHFNR
jgi:DNA invertase Pin-like site-specific DNA recombinase